MYRPPVNGDVSGDVNFLWSFSLLRLDDWFCGSSERADKLPPFFIYSFLLCNVSCDCLLFVFILLVKSSLILSRDVSVFTSSTISSIGFSAGILFTVAFNFSWELDYERTSDCWRLVPRFLGLMIYPSLSLRTSGFKAISFLLDWNRVGAGPLSYIVLLLLNTFFELLDMPIAFIVFYVLSALILLFISSNSFIICSFSLANFS